MTNIKYDQNWLDMTKITYDQNWLDMANIEYDQNWLDMTKIQLYHIPTTSTANIFPLISVNLFLV